MTQVPEGLNDDIEEPVRGRLQRDPAAAAAPGDPVEDRAAYERAVEEDTVLAPDGDTGGTGDTDADTPVFQEPGSAPQ